VVGVLVRVHSRKGADLGVGAVNVQPREDAVAGQAKPAPELVYTWRFLRKRPLLRLDEDGLEWAAGRIRWADVTRMEFFQSEGRR